MADCTWLALLISYTDQLTRSISAGTAACYVRITDLEPSLDVMTYYSLGVPGAVLAQLPMLLHNATRCPMDTWHRKIQFNLRGY